MNKENICLKYKCSKCCSPVKMRKGFKAARPNVLASLPLVDRNETWIPETSPDTTRLETYDCMNFDPETGLCKDYENRPDICRNTECRAFNLDTEEDQQETVNKIKNEKFYICKRK